MKLFRRITALRATCPRCNGTGGHSDFGNKVFCQKCGGSGQV